ncbi:MAG TPA: hypothetical protein VGH30_05150 [Jatrophihabitantaceae bacterium]|jgi:hypothetical protein
MAARRTPPRQRPPRRRRDDDPVLPDRTSDERDVGWGEDPESGGRDDEWYRRERPPHHE